MTIAFQRLRGIYAIVNEGSHDPVALVRALLDGGIRIFQYRAKNGIVLERLQAIREVTRERNALLIVNDDWNAARDLGADGAHVGPDDATPQELPKIRKHMQGLLLGVSCGTIEESRQAQLAGADYIGVGAVYATGSKADAGAPIGIAGLQRVAAATTLPVAAIGGISIDTIEDVAASGVAMAAVLCALATPSNPAAAAERFVNLWNGAT
ncbi:MAG: thiamine phosphate synthase [Candidatus Eremiobacteraeota bacterium]|nr:thiamine phosphate synthase [Candidatus Eremiobacteraeota bacterium]